MRQKAHCSSTKKRVKDDWELRRDPTSEVAIWRGALAYESSPGCLPLVRPVSSSLSTMTKQVIASIRTNSIADHN